MLSNKKLDKKSEDRANLDDELESVSDVTADENKVNLSNDSKSVNNKKKRISFREAYNQLDEEQKKLVKKNLIKNLVITVVMVSVASTLLVFVLTS